MVNYYQLPEVSSSDLGELERMFYDRPRPDLEQVFAFGSLVDAMLTEQSKLKTLTLQLVEDGGNVLHFSYETWRLASKLATILQRDPLVSCYLPGSIGQYIFRRTLSFTYNGEEQKIRGRCKFDLFNKAHKTGLDFKTTSCKTYKAFVACIEHFDWDKQAAWYMDLARIDYHWIIGISKSTSEVFKYAIKRGDATHTHGVAKYSLWAHRWNYLIEPFEQQLLKVA